MWIYFFVDIIFNLGTLKKFLWYLSLIKNTWNKD